jgi:glutaredoxin-related protein
MKLKDFIRILFVTTICISCNPFKYTFVPIEPNYDAEKISRSIKSLKPNQLFLIFTKNYQNSRIKLYSDDLVLFDSTITTNLSGNLMGLAKAFKVDKESKIIIHFDDIKKPLTITPQQMKEYKLIYLIKEKGRVEIEFNNNPRALVTFPKKRSLKDSIH